MGTRKRPASPAAVALLTFVGVVVVGTFVLALLIGGGPGSVARLERAGQGLGSLGLIIAVLAYFSARSRWRQWDADQADDPRAQKIRAGGDKLRSRVRCKRCGLVILSADHSWQKESYCSEKCRRLSGPR